MEIASDLGMGTVFSPQYWERKNKRTPKAHWLVEPN